MPSLKDQGTQYYKQKKYKQAIKCYEQYLHQPHQDNHRAAYANGLCYSSLKQHQKAIHYYEMAITIDSKYQKPYYKLMKEYVLVNQGKNSYNIYINAYQFLRFSDKVEFQKQREQAQKLMSQNKKFMLENVPRGNYPAQSENIFQILQDLIPNIQQSQNFKTEVDKYASEWLGQWNKEGLQSDDAKWQEIKFIIQEDYNHGINLAHFYINQMVNLPERKRVSSQLKKLKKERASKLASTNDHDNDKDQDITKQLTQQEVKAKQNTLNSYHFDKLQKKDELGDKLISKKFNYFSSLPKANQTKEEQEVNNRELEAKISLSKTALEEIKANNIMIPQDADIQVIYKAYCKDIQTKKDIFGQSYKSIINILSGNQNTQIKGNLLILLKKRLKKFKMIIQSFTQTEQAKIYHLLVQNKIEEYSIDFAPILNKA